MQWARRGMQQGKGVGRLGGRNMGLNSGDRIGEE